MVVKCCGTNGGRRKAAEHGALDMKRRKMTKCSIGCKFSK
jgi:hypothetical protein